MVLVSILSRRSTIASLSWRLCVLILLCVNPISWDKFSLMDFWDSVIFRCDTLVLRAHTYVCLANSGIITHRFNFSSQSQPRYFIYSTTSKWSSSWFFDCLRCAIIVFDIWYLVIFISRIFYSFFLQPLNNLEQGHLIASHILPDKLTPIVRGVQQTTTLQLVDIYLCSFSTYSLVITDKSGPSLSSSSSHCTLKRRCLSIFLFKWINTWNIFILIYYKT